MADDILHNSPALHALKRHQLVSLSKKCGLKASGKNDDMIDRLKEYASTLTPSRKSHSTFTATTPAGPGDFADQSVGSRVEASRHQSRPSDTWEVLSESNASIASPHKRDPSQSGSVSSWRSAGNGKPLNEFGEADSEASNSKSSRSSSFKAFADVTRRASVHLFSRSTSGSVPNPTDQPLEVPPVEPSPIEPMEVVDDPPSPASTVGVARRHSTISLLERPSTIRLVSPPPVAPTDEDKLPFFSPPTNLQAMKQRRSMAPLRSPQGQATSALNRRSMPALSSDAGSSASVPSIYPPLPGDIARSPPPQRVCEEPEPVQRVITHKNSAVSISNAQFEDIGKRVLAEMEAKMKANLGERAPSFGQELLRGRLADLGSLVKVDSTLNQGSWGLAAGPNSKKDRYAEAHAREFKRMQSIDQVRNASGGQRKASAPVGPPLKPTVELPVAATPGQKRKHSNLPSAPNGAPLIPMDDERDSKRKRLSFGPNAMGSLRGAGRSLVNVIGEQLGAPTPKRPVAALRKTPRRRRSSVTASKGGGLASRFGFFQRKKRVSLDRRQQVASAAAATVSKVAGSTLGSTRPTIASSIREQETLRSSRTTSTSRPGQSKSRHPSTSAASTLSTTSKSRARPKLPEFGNVPTSSSRSGSVNALGLPTQGGSMSSTLSTRKQSQAEMIRKARPAPAPPATGFGTIELTATGELKAPPSSYTLNSSTNSSMNKRTSTLLQPTASSIARMQATVRPQTDRPLPSLPKTNIATAKPFGQGSSRDDSTFDSSFNVPKPLYPPSAFSSPPPAPSVDVQRNGSRTTPRGPRAPLRTATTNLKSPGKSPGKNGSMAGKRARNRAGGVSSIKAKGNVKGSMDVNHRRAEMRAKQERLNEERGLREMLGGDFGMSE